jgi:hypothetical protein
MEPKMLDLLCPFFKETCHNNKCMMWKNEDCSIVAFLQRLEEPLEEVEIEVPEWLQTMAPENIAKEIIELKKKEFPDDPFSVHSAIHFYWRSKGIEMSGMPIEIQLKMSKIDMLVEKAQTDEQKTRMLKERQQLPSLVNECVEWAKLNELKSLLVRDVKTFTLEKDLDLLRETEGALCSMANTRLKKER